MKAVKSFFIKAFWAYIIVCHALPYFAKIAYKTYGPGAQVRQFLGIEQPISPYKQMYKDAQSEIQRLQERHNGPWSFENKTRRHTLDEAYELGQLDREETIFRSGNADLSKYDLEAERRKYQRKKILQAQFNKRNRSYDGYTDTYDQIKAIEQGKQIPFHNSTRKWYQSPSPTLSNMSPRERHMNRCHADGSPCASHILLCTHCPTQKP